MIELTVGGTKFYTTKSTLELCPYFSKINLDEHIEINRDFVAFKHVLNYMRSSNYQVPHVYLAEKQFYFKLKKM